MYVCNFFISTHISQATTLRKDLKDLARVGSCCWNWNLNTKESINDFKILNISFWYSWDNFTHEPIFGIIEEGRQKTDVAWQFDITTVLLPCFGKHFKGLRYVPRITWGSSWQTTGILSYRQNKGPAETDSQVENKFLAATSKWTWHLKNGSQVFVTRKTIRPQTCYACRIVEHSP